MRSPAYVVSTGVITAIGKNTEECRDSLRSGRSGIGSVEHLKTYWQNELPAGEVKYSNEALAQMAEMSLSLPRTALLSALAVQEAWQPLIKPCSGLRTGFLSANTVGGMDLTEGLYNKFRNSRNLNGIEDIFNHECGAITELVARKFQLTDFTTTVSTACSSSANSIMMAAQMIENDMLDVAVAGGADCLSRFTLNGFNTLMILDRQLCQPFDQHRRGLNLGEGAGYIVLMNERALFQCKASVICRLSGYANANDAYHQTASSPEGTGNKLAMLQALARAGLQPSEVDYINLHGTGTANNDSAEAGAISSVFEGNIPPASSTKAFTGHTLGACGGVEAVFSILSVKEGVIFPNLRWEKQMEGVSWKPVTIMQEGLDIKHVLSNSFGFGGNCSSLIFSKI